MASNYPQAEPVVVERHTAPGGAPPPHCGKVFACVQAHSDDVPLMCAGLLAKLLAEGYTGHLIQTTNDMMCGPSPSMGETILQNEREVEALAKALGLQSPVINLGYRNHFLDEASVQELRARLVFLFRALKVDTVISFNPWAHGEENPDHYVTGQACEAAKWMAGGDKDYPEHFLAGVMSHQCTDQWYFCSRPGSPFNRVVDISPFIGTKVETMALNRAQGPAGSQGSQLRRELEALGLSLPLLGDSDEEADRRYIREFGLESYRQMGLAHGVQYAERFFYIGEGGAFSSAHSSEKLCAMVAEQAVAATSMRSGTGGESGAAAADAARAAAVQTFVERRRRQSIYDQMQGKRVVAAEPAARHTHQSSPARSRL